MRGSSREEICMARPEDSAWAVSVAQVASRPGQSKTVDAVFPAPSGIGDEVIGRANDRYRQNRAIMTGGMA